MASDGPPVHLMNARALDWDGCVNLRDLGGLEVVGGGTTRWRAAVRGDHPSRLTAKGWQALWDYGVRSILELTTLGVEATHQDAAQRPPELVHVEVDVEDVGDGVFVTHWVKTGLWCSPLYYADALARWPQRHVRAVRTFATAPAGGVLLHCKRGHDRTGIISLLLLALAGVHPRLIAEDYDLSDANMPERERRQLRGVLAAHSTTASETIGGLLNGFDAAQYLKDAGLDPETIRRAKARLVAG